MHPLSTWFYPTIIFLIQTCSSSTQNKNSNDALQSAYLESLILKSKSQQQQQNTHPQTTHTDHLEFNVLIDTNLIKSEKYISKLARKFNCFNYGRILHHDVDSNGNSDSNRENSSPGNPLKSKLKEYRFVSAEHPTLTSQSKQSNPSSRRNSNPSNSLNSYPMNSLRRIHFPTSVRKVTKVLNKKRVLRLDALSQFDDIPAIKKQSQSFLERDLDLKNSKINIIEEDEQRIEVVITPFRDLESHFWSIGHDDDEISEVVPYIQVQDDTFKRTRGENSGDSDAKAALASNLRNVNNLNSAPSDDNDDDRLFRSIWDWFSPKKKPQPTSQLPPSDPNSETQSPSDNKFSNADIYKYAPEAPNFNDPMFNVSMWYFKLLNITGAWQQGYTGKGVVVTVLDDGIEFTHPDLDFNDSPSASTDVRFGVF